VVLKLSETLIHNVLSTKYLAHFH